VLRIMPNSDMSCASPSITQSALKILWRQCSEFACATSSARRRSGCVPACGNFRRDSRSRQAKEPAPSLCWLSPKPCGHPSKHSRWQAVAACRAGRFFPPHRRYRSTRSRHAVVQQRQHSSLFGIAQRLATRRGKVVHHAALDALHTGQPAMLRNIGGLGGPRRDCAKARHTSRRWNWPASPARLRPAQTSTLSSRLACALLNTASCSAQKYQWRASAMVMPC